MYSKLLHFLMHNRFITLCLLLFVIALGLWFSPFYDQIGEVKTSPVAVDAIPNLGENQQIVFTKWPGRSPQDIEDQVTYPLMTALMGVPRVKTVRSSSMFGYSMIYVIFEDGVDFYWGRTRILEKLNALSEGSLPDGVKPTLGPDATALGQVFWYTIEGQDNEGKSTGGWDLHELRSVQDYYVKYALATVEGVSEVASIGGFVQAYEVVANADQLHRYGLTLLDLLKAVKESNEDTGAQTIEVNKVEYFVRGIGYVKKIKDIEEAVVKVYKNTPILVKDVAQVVLTPLSRRGILDKEGAEAVGGVVTARYDANAMQVIQKVENKLKMINAGMPEKILPDGQVSKLHIVPFYNRRTLIQETLYTLNEALSLEVLITIIVIFLMLTSGRMSLLVAGLLPVAVLSVFISMKIFGVTANIVSLAGIAIAIGTMVDLGVILGERIVEKWQKRAVGDKASKVVMEAVHEVAPAMTTAVLTTIVSFIPVFALSGVEGKMFFPLAFSKTSALVSAWVVSLFLMPPLAVALFQTYSWQKYSIVKRIMSWMSGTRGLWIRTAIVVIALVTLLARMWHPMKLQGMWLNWLLVVLICGGTVGLFMWFQKSYPYLLRWCLAHRYVFFLVPIFLVIGGILAFHKIGSEFMPALDEGSFLLMPTSMPHTGVSENKRILQYMDKAVASIPEVESVVGKAGRTESPLDPAPLSMFENVINYKTEYVQDEKGRIRFFKTNSEGLFLLHDGGTVANPNNTLDKQGTVPFAEVTAQDLVEASGGKPYRQWRKNILSKEDIWTEIVRLSKWPGVTSAPMLQPIETRLLMLQSGMRTPMGIQVQGKSLADIERFSQQIEHILKGTPDVDADAVFADRIVSKPYVVIDLDRKKMARYGLSIKAVQQVIKTALGGMPLSQVVLGRERYTMQVRYPRELRDSPEDIAKVYVPAPTGETVRLGQIANVQFATGPQVIKSENGFLVSYVLFDKLAKVDATKLVDRVQKNISEAIDKREVIVPSGVTYSFVGDYQQQKHANNTLKVVIPLCLLVIFLILYFQFRSMTTSMMIFVGISVAFAGGMIMLWMMDKNISVAVWVGFIALFGISTDDGVVMTTYLNKYVRRGQVANVSQVREQVLAGATQRIRPCLMTTVTTILALLPILTSTGRGSDIMIPMAIPCFGGMLLDVTSYFMVPVLYAWREEIIIKKL